MFFMVQRRWLRVAAANKNNQKIFKEIFFAFFHYRDTKNPARGQFHQHSKRSFYANILKKLKLNVITKKLNAKLSYKKAACKCW
jgi:hypothetical protein